MRQMHGPFKTLLFEPIFYDEARMNLKGLGVEVYPYGLGATTRSATFDIKGDATTPTKDGQVAQIRRFSDVIEELSIVRIDLLQINCEGCEWEVLESVIDDKQTHIFQHIQVQFHPSADWVEDRLDRYATIQDRLTETHELLYDHPWIWQLWQSKSYRRCLTKFFPEVCRRTIANLSEFEMDKMYQKGPKQAQSHPIVFVFKSKKDTV